MNTVRSASEIVILRRFPGYLRLHIPPLIYTGKAAYLLEKALLAMDGIRKVSIQKQLGKLSIHFDEVLTQERAVLLVVNEVATPLLRGDEQPLYEKTLAEVENVERKLIARKVVVAAILAYLLKVHWRLLSRKWIQDPVAHWPKLVSIATILYIHRKHIKGAVTIA